MRQHPKTTFLMILAMAVFSSALLSAIAPQQSRGSATTKEARVARGAHLVQTMGCNDCHTPWKMGPRGPEPDMSRALTGHPEEMKMPPAPVLPPGPWMWVAAATNTAFAGPWGTSFTANLTPDPRPASASGPRRCSSRRCGRDGTRARDARCCRRCRIRLSAALEDEDIKSLFAYLQSLTPVKNRVPAPVDPPEEKR